ncbi:MAG TPA: hypothetical protein VEX68_20955 [Bryobacteraceae bacterium]|nr:hypothetical protein [Bryobacteraceae bacterium]
MQAAVLDEREDGVVARPVFFGPEEEPVSLSEAGWAYRVLD